MPRLPSGKLDYEALRARLRAEPPARGDLFTAFREAFFPHRVRAEDSFASLCGDSLRHVELSMVLERRLGHVPPGWEHLSLAELSRLGPRESKKRGVESTHVFRALAILLVVTQHATLWPIPGGSAAMMVLIGFGLARFRAGALIAGDFGTFFRPLLAVLLPYYVILAGYVLAWGTVPLSSLFLVGNFGIGDPAQKTMLPYLYWFVEAFVQLMLLIAGLFLIPPVRRLAARDPFRLGLALLAAALLARWLGPILWPIGGRQIFAPWWVFHLAAFGWCAAVADTRTRRLSLLAIAALAMPALAYAGGNWTGSWVKYGMQFALIAALMYVPRISLPSAAALAVGIVAAAGYHIYLFHRFVPELLFVPLETAMPAWAFTVLAIAGGVGLGILAFEAQRALWRSMLSLLETARRRPAAALPDAAG